MAPSRADNDTPSAPTTFPPPIPPPADLAHNHQTFPSSTPPGATTPATSPPSPSPSTSTHPSAQTNPSVSEALTTIRPYDFTGVHLRPCSRESLITGMGAGFGVGGLRFVLGARQHTAMSWAVGAFCLTSMGAYAFCRERRRLEKAAMERAREIMERKQREKMREAAREKARRRAEIEAQGRASQTGGAGGGGWFGWGGKKE